MEPILIDLGDLDEDGAALLLQKVARGFLVRRFMKKDDERRRVVQQLEELRSEKAKAEATEARRTLEGLGA